jgi:hypothetical protein
VPATGVLSVQIGAVFAAAERSSVGSRTDSLSNRSLQGTSQRDTCPVLVVLSPSTADSVTAELFLPSLPLPLRTRRLSRAP